jgi:hypothetical protein
MLGPTFLQFRAQTLPPLNPVKKTLPSSRGASDAGVFFRAQPIPPRPVEGHGLVASGGARDERGGRRVVTGGDRREGSVTNPPLQILSIDTDRAHMLFYYQ